MFSDINFVEPVERTLDSKFKFRCHKDIGCFNKCCTRADILLTPYDVLRMKRRLGISSEEFLEKYTHTHIDENSSHPYALLVMMDDNEGKCPFLTPEGCSIYEDRPTNCRHYPVGQGIMISGPETEPVTKDFFFFIREPGCLGYNEEKEWIIVTWRVDQGLDLYDDINREWKEIQLRRDAQGQDRLDPKSQALIYMASYDLDKFRKFVFESRLLDIIDTEEVETIKNDEVALMKFGFKYLKYVLMLEETLKVKEEYKEKTTDAGNM